MTSSLLTRTLPPILKKGISRLCCKRRALEIEILNSSAASAIVSRSASGSGSIDIVVKELCRVGAICRRALQPYHCSDLGATCLNHSRLSAIVGQQIPSTMHAEYVRHH